MSVNTGGVHGCTGGTYDRHGAMALEEDCDILIAAAPERAIHRGNAAAIKA